MGVEVDRVEKRFRSRADLAILGHGKPAKESLLHVGRPRTAARDQFLALAAQSFDRSWFTNDGPLLRELESRLEEYLQVRHCVLMSNGTLALMTLIRALGLAGEVILPSFTFVATAHALQWQGITPVFADIDPVTHSLDPESVRSLVNERTSAILGVHLWGRPADVDGLRSVADEFGLKLIFDAAHAFACSHDGRMIGGFGNAEVLSFHATKFFSTFEGGAVATDDDALAESLRLQRNFGFAGFDNVVAVGINAKMNEICAAMGLANLPHVEEYVALNRVNHEAYEAALAGIQGLRLLPFDPGQMNNYQYAVVEVGPECPLGRDDVLSVLIRENIFARRYFWPGCHRMAPYRELYPDSGGRLPVTERISEMVLVLPSGGEVDPRTCELISDAIRLAVEHPEDVRKATSTGRMGGRMSTDPAVVEGCGLAGVASTPLVLLQ